MAIWWRLFATGAVTYGIYRDNDRQPNMQTDWLTNIQYQYQPMVFSIVSHYAWCHTTHGSARTCAVWTCRYCSRCKLRLRRIGAYSGVHTPNSISIGSSVSAGLTLVTDRDHATCVTMCTAMRRSVCVCVVERTRWRSSECCWQENDDESRAHTQHCRSRRRHFHRRICTTSIQYYHCTYRTRRPTHVWTLYITVMRHARCYFSWKQY